MVDIDHKIGSGRFIWKSSASIRIPIGTVERGWKGWLEDRRPNSAADPYKVAARIVKTVKSAEVEMMQEEEKEAKVA